MTYAVELTKRASKDFAALPREVHPRIAAALHALGENPRPSGIRALQGEWKGHYRLRVGDYRIIYRVEDARVIVTVVRIADRKDVYG